MRVSESKGKESEVRCNLLTFHPLTSHSNEIKVGLTFISAPTPTSNLKLTLLFPPSPFSSLSSSLSRTGQRLVSLLSPFLYCVQGLTG